MVRPIGTKLREDELAVSIAASERRYKVRPGTYYLQLNQQGGACAICRVKPEAGMLLLFDHDHNTGLFRGLLCLNCNSGIGMFKDDVALLDAAISYLTRYYKTQMED